jgi:competence ComEA-like helix-hairpin-helix protein
MNIERRGSVILIVIILLFAFIPRLYSYLFPNQNHIDYDEIAPLIAQWDSLRPNNDSVVVELFTFNPNTITFNDLLRLGLPKNVARKVISYRTKYRKFEKKEDMRRVYDMTDSLYARIEPFVDLSQEREDEHLGFASEPKMFEFDPNTVTKKELLQLGVNEKAANSWINWRNKGAVFYTKAKVKKVRGLTDVEFQRIEPYIVIKAPYADNIPKSYDQQKIKIDVNTATVEDFKQLRGIGEKTAKRIINFRNALGGFITVKQVSETWGLPKETFYNLQPQFTITTDNINKININTATKEILSKHPYLKWNHAQAIINYRKQHGNFETVRDLKKIVLINGELFVKIEPYLVVE